MRQLSASELLEVWERGLTLEPARRALALLAAAQAGQPDELARLSIGRRDAALLTLREQTFGPRLESVATCPVCREPLELAFDAAEIRVEPPADAAEPRLRVGQYEARLRLPNSLDLLAPAEPAELLARCLVSAECGGRPVAADELPAEVVAAIDAALAEADPQADVELGLTCPACAHAWLAPFDVLEYFWAEIGAWAVRLLHDVHSLASSYGWREADVLALSPWRREFYLQAIGR
jgi:hypothetical protein